MHIEVRGKKLFLPVLILVSAIVIDTVIIRINHLTASSVPITWKLFIFVLISSMYIVGQYFTIRLMPQVPVFSRSSNYINMRIKYRIIGFLQYLLIAILLLVILQIFLGSFYSVIALAITSTTSYGVVISIMILLTRKFVVWYSIKKDPVVLLYGLSSVIIGINGLFAILFLDSIFLAMPSELHQHVGNFPLFVPRGSLIELMNLAYIGSSIISFVVTWVATSLLLRFYSKRIGKVRYWAIICIPLTFFLSQFIGLVFNLYGSILGSDPISRGIFFTLLFSFSKAAGGILFGAAFWLISRTIPRDNPVRNYLAISAYGFILLFTSSQSIILAASTYPPFGLISVSVVWLSSYLILIGVYSSAISYSQDTKLRQTIRRVAISESGMLDSIGSAQKQEVIEKKVMTMIKDEQNNMSRITGIESSLSDEELRGYLHDVLREMKRKRS